MHEGTERVIRVDIDLLFLYASYTYRLHSYIQQTYNLQNRHHIGKHFYMIRLLSLYSSHQFFDTPECSEESLSALQIEYNYRTALRLQQICCIHIKHAFDFPSYSLQEISLAIAKKTASIHAETDQILLIEYTDSITKAIPRSSSKRPQKTLSSCCFLFKECRNAFEVGLYIKPKLL